MQLDPSLLSAIKIALATPDQSELFPGDKLCEMVAKAVLQSGQQNTGALHGMPRLYWELALDQHGNANLNAWSTKSALTVISSVVQPEEHLCVKLDRRLYLVGTKAGETDSSELSKVAAIFGGRTARHRPCAVIGTGLMGT